MAFFKSIQKYFRESRIRGEDARREIERAIEDANDAFARADVDAALSHATSTFKYVDLESKVQTLDELRHNLEVAFKDLSSPHHHTTIRNFALRGEKAILTTQESTSGSMKGSPIAIVRTCEDIWISTPQGWEIETSRCLWQNTMTLDADNNDRP